MSKGWFKKEDVMRAAKGRWAEVLSRLGVDASLLTNRHGPCPGCGGKDRFRYDDKDGEGSFICSQGGGGALSGDGIALLQHVTGDEWKVALEKVGELVCDEADRQGVRGGGGSSGGTAGPRPDAGVSKAPERKREEWIPNYDEERTRQLVKAVPDLDEGWYLKRSPVAVDKVGPGDFLEAVFEPGERALVFTNFYSQGDFLWEVGRGGYRLAGEQGIKAVRSDLPTNGGADGVWYASNPVDGQWHPNPRRGGQLSRRAEESVTQFRHLVLESDEAKKWVKLAAAAEEPKEKERLLGKAREAVKLWLRFLAMCPLPVKAVYSSGQWSWHALVVVHAPSKADFDTLMRNKAKKTLPIFGADPAAMTAVRLTRLPGCTRKGQLQRLIYLDPKAGGEGSIVRIWDKPAVR